MLPSLFRQFEREGYTYDPGFSLNPLRPDDTFKELTDGLDPDLWDGYEDALSMPHALKIREQLVELQDKRAKLASLGWQGTALRIGASILDPVAIAADIGVTALAGPYGGAAAFGNRANRLRRLVRGGLIASTVEGSLEAYLTTQDPERGPEDVLYAVAGAGVLGGGIEAFGPEAVAAIKKWATRTRRGIEQRDVQQAIVSMGAASNPKRTPQELQKALREQILTEDGQRRFARDIPAEQQKEYVEAVIRLQGLDDETADALRAMDPADVVGDLQEANRMGKWFDPPEPPKPRKAADGGDGDTPGGDGGDTDDFDPGPDGFDPSWERQSGGVAMTKARFSLLGRLGASESPTARRFADMGLDDPIAKKSGVSGEAATGWKRRIGERLTRHFYDRDWGKDIAEYRRSRGMNAAQSLRARDELMQEVGMAIRGGNVDALPDGPVKRRAKRTQNLIQRTFEIAQGHGVRGLEDTISDQRFLPRLWNVRQLDRAIHAYGEEGVDELLAAAIKAKRPDIDADKLTKVARTFRKAIQKLDSLTDVQRGMVFDGDDPDIIANTLRQILGDDISDADVGDIVQILAPRTQEQGVITPRARRRFDLDETIEIPLTNNADGIPNEMVSIQTLGLVENNAERLFHVYKEQMIGAAAMTRIFKELSEEGEEITNFAQLRNKVARELELKGLGAQDQAARNELKRLDTAYRIIMGLPVRDRSALDTISSNIRAYNYFRVGGQFVVAQTSELGNILGEYGLSAVFKQVPAFNLIRNMASNGKINNELLAELDEMVTVGISPYSHDVIGRFDDIGIEASSRGLNRALRVGGRFQTVWSGFHAIDTASRQMAASAAVQRVADQAFSGKRPSSIRLRSLGLTTDDWDEIAAAIKANGTYERGILGRKIRRMNIDNWDAATRHKLTVALERWSTRTVQVHDASQMAEWMNGPLAKMILQFRSFAIGAWERQFLFRVNEAMNKDLSTFIPVLYSGVVAAMAYVGQQYVQTIGMDQDQREEFLKDRLTPKNLAAVGFQRSGFSSLLPGAIDTGIMLSGGKEWFNQGRNTQLDSDFFFGSPATDTANKAGLVARSVGRDIRSRLGERFGERGQADYFSRKDFERFADLLPLNRVFGLKNVLNYAASNIPKEDDR